MLLCFPRYLERWRNSTGSPDSSTPNLKKGKNKNRSITRMNRRVYAEQSLIINALLAGRFCEKVEEAWLMVAQFLLVILIRQQTKAGRPKNRFACGQIWGFCGCRRVCRFQFCSARSHPGYSSSENEEITSDRRVRNAHLLERTRLWCWRF